MIGGLAGLVLGMVLTVFYFSLANAKVLEGRLRSWQRMPWQRGSITRKRYIDSARHRGRSLDDSEPPDRNCSSMVVSRRVGLLDVRFEYARPKRCACRYQRCLQRQLQVCTRPDNSEAVSARIRRRIVDRHIHFLSASRVPQSSLQLQPERSARRGDGKIQVESRQVGN